MKRPVVLFVMPDSHYKTLGLECYDEQRDAKTYTGNSPVVAHPPCQLWGKMAKVNFVRERKLAGQVKEKPRKGLRKVAKGNAARDREYREWVKKEMAGRCICRKCLRTFDSIQPHHPFGRGGNNLFRVTPLCALCHAWVHDNSCAAYDAGWLQPEYRGYAPNPKHPQPFTLLPR